MKPTDFTELAIEHRNSPAMQELRTVSTLQSVIKLLKILLIGSVIVTDIIGLALFTKKQTSVKNFKKEEEN